MYVDHCFLRNVEITLQPYTPSFTILKNRIFVPTPILLSLTRRTAEFASPMAAPINAATPAALPSREQRTAVEPRRPTDGPTSRCQRIESHPAPHTSGPAIPCVGRRSHLSLACTTGAGASAFSGLLLSVRRSLLLQYPSRSSIRPFLPERFKSLSLFLFI